MLAGKKVLLAKRSSWELKIKISIILWDVLDNKGWSWKDLGPQSWGNKILCFGQRVVPSPPLFCHSLMYSTCPLIQKGSIFGSVACVASVSNWVIAQKLEQEQKNKMEGERGGGKEGMLFPSLSSPYPVIPFLCSCLKLVSNLSCLAKLARKRLLRRLFVAGWGALDTITSSKRYGKWLNSRKIMLLGTLSLLYSHWLFLCYTR